MESNIHEDRSGRDTKPSWKNLVAIQATSRQVGSSRFLSRSGEVGDGGQLHIDSRMN